MTFGPTTAIRRAPPAPPQQLAFLDAPAELPHLRIAAMGVLMRDPELRTRIEGFPSLTVVLLQPGDDLPLIATWRPTTSDDVGLEALAGSLRRGSTVLVRGCGLRRVAVPSDIGWALALQRCESVSAIAVDGASPSNLTR